MNSHTHIFFSENKILRELGLSRYTLAQLKEYCDAYDKSGNEIEILTINPDGKPCDADDLYEVLCGNVSKPSVEAYDESTKKYSNTVEINNLSGFISEYNKYLDDKYNKRDVDTDIEQLVYKIRGSKYKCGIFKPKLYFSIKNTSNVLEFEPEIKIFLRNPFEDKLQPENYMSLKRPVISDVPYTTAGTEYSWLQRKEDKKEEYYLYNGADIDGSDLNNKVAGYLDIHYNENTGKYEAGTKQLLARLLGSLSPVQSPSLTDENLDKVYEDEQLNQLGDWDKDSHSTSAVPIYKYNNNSTQIGPAFILDKDGNKKIEKVRVINRAPVSFEAGELVILNFINGEWIPMKFAESGGKVVDTSLSVQKWRFTKLIASSDSYFMDDRYFNNLDDPNFDSQFYQNVKITHDNYIQKFRNRYYLNLQDKEVAYINLYNTNIIPENYEELVNNKAADLPSWDFVPSLGYYQDTILNQMGKFAGGIAEKNIIARTNLIHPPDGLPEDSVVPGYKLMEFWGPSFRDGYKSQEVQELLNKRSEVVIKRGYVDNYEKVFTATPENPAIIDSIFDGGQEIGERKYITVVANNYLRMFGNSQDLNAKNFPAEIATIAKLDDDGIGSPLEDFSYYQSLLPYLSLIDNRKRFISIVQEDDSSLYNLTPINPNVIDFFLLNAEIVSSLDYTGSGQTKQFANETLMNQHLRELEPKSLIFDKDFGGIFSKYDFYRSNYFLDGNIIPYDNHVKERSSGNFGGMNLPFLWEEDTADCIGIIASVMTIKTASNKLKFVVDQDFGYVTRRVLGGFEFVQWGGSSDDPERFHTTALHVKVFDKWPVEQTIYDARYFAPLHFNPGFGVFEAGRDEYGNVVKTYDIDMIAFRLSGNYFLLEDGFVVTNDDIVLEETVDVSRRGKLLSNGGFYYKEQHIGIHPDLYVENWGDVQIGDEIEATGGSGNGAKIKIIDSNGDLSYEVINRGSGYRQEDFAESRTEIPSLGLDTYSGSTQVIFEKDGFRALALFGQVYYTIGKDEGPKEHTAILRLTDGNNRGKGNTNKGPVRGIKETLLSIEEPNSSGEYDLFFFCHNDISHTHCYESAYSKQRISLEVLTV